MRKGLLPKTLTNLQIRGFEGDEEEENNSESEESEEEESEDKEKPENNDALKSALRKERTERKRLDREAREMKKRLEELDNKEKTETDKAKADASKAESKADKLASALKNTAVDNVVIRVAGKLKFRDLDDALKLVDRESIEVDQDEDEPADVTIDEATVEEALKALAKKKPHLIVAEGQEERSGSKFAGGRGKSKEEDDEAVLRKKYPALNRTPAL
jgi:hypothetical protein